MFVTGKQPRPKKPAISGNMRRHMSYFISRYLNAPFIVKIKHLTTKYPDKLPQLKAKIKPTLTRLCQVYQDVNRLSVLPHCLQSLLQLIYVQLTTNETKITVNNVLGLLIW